MDTKVTHEQHETHEKENHPQTTRFIDRLRTAFQKNPINNVIAIVLLLTAIMTTVNGVQTRQETQSIAQNNPPATNACQPQGNCQNGQCPAGTYCTGSGPAHPGVCMPLSCPPTPTVALPDAIKQAQTACIQNNGKWSAEHFECDGYGNRGFDQATCTAMGGTYTPCVSACRHMPQTLASKCTQSCVQLCKFQPNQQGNQPAPPTQATTAPLPARQPTFDSAPVLTGIVVFIIAMIFLMFNSLS
jgi:hypothetical protein